MSAGSFLKKEWMELPEIFFTPLTFGELKIGEKFIDLPLPGDNHGHGGFRGTHNVFTKTSPGDATDNRGISSMQPDTMFVIRIE